MRPSFYRDDGDCPNLCRSRRQQLRAEAPPSPHRLLAQEGRRGGVPRARQSGGARGGFGVPNNNVILVQER